jgi:uncharacterized protein (DUF2267 family)
MVMSFTGVTSLDSSIMKTSTWMADIDRELGTDNRQLAYRVARAWMHCLRDRLTVEVAANFAAQLPELLCGVFYDGWNPAHLPERYGRDEYVVRFVQEARVGNNDVSKVAKAVTAVAREHISAGVIDEAFALLPADLRTLLDTTEPPVQAR